MNQHLKNCSWSEDALQQYHDKLLEKESVKAFETHLSICPSCCESLKSLKILKEFLYEEMRRAVETPSLKGLEDRVLSQIQEEKIIPFPTIIKPQALRFLNFSKGIAAAAIFLIALGGYWHFHNNSSFFMASTGKQGLCEVDYFYSQTQEDVVCYNVNNDTESSLTVIWVLDEMAP